MSWQPEGGGGFQANQTDSDTPVSNGRPTGPLLLQWEGGSNDFFPLFACCLILCNFQISKADSDVAGQNTFYGAPLEDGEDGRWKTSAPHLPQDMEILLQLQACGGSWGFVVLNAPQEICQEIFQPYIYTVDVSVSIFAVTCVQTQHNEILMTWLQCRASAWRSSRTNSSAEKMLAVQWPDGLRKEALKQVVQVTPNTVPLQTPYWLLLHTGHCLTRSLTHTKHCPTLTTSYYSCSHTEHCSMLTTPYWLLITLTTDSYRTLSHTHHWSILTTALSCTVHCPLLTTPYWTLSHTEHCPTLPIFTGCNPLCLHHLHCYLGPLVSFLPLSSCLWAFNNSCW